MNTAIAAREAWLAENPDNKKMLLDVPFKNLVAQPKEIVKAIDEYFGMGSMPDFEQAHDSTLNDSNTQKNVKSVVPDELFACNPEEIDKRFHFYHDDFKEFISFIDCEETKKAPLAMLNSFPASRSSWTSIFL